MDEATFWETAIREPNGCWLWAGAVARDYGVVQFKKKAWRAHRLAWTLANKRPIPEGLYILHTCDEPLCIRPDHLYTGTQSDNMKDAYARGRWVRKGQPGGEAHAMAKLTENDVDVIRKRLLAGETQARLSLEYGVTQSNISSISRGVSWQHLKWEPLPIRCGSAKPGAKLTEEDIPLILKRIQDGDSISRVAHDFKVGRTLISDIWHGKKWKHIPRPQGAFNSQSASNSS